MKFSYNRKLFHLPRCRGVAASFAFDATRTFGSGKPPEKASKSLAGLDSSNTPDYNAHKRNYAGSKLEKKEKEKTFSVMLACRENNSMYKEISRATYEQDFTLAFCQFERN